MSRLLGLFVLHVLWSLACRMSSLLAGQASSFSHVTCSVFRVRLGLSTFSVCPYIGSFVCLFYIFNYYLMGYHACVTLIIYLLGFFLALFPFLSHFSALVVYILFTLMSRTDALC